MNNKKIKTIILMSIVIFLLISILIYIKVIKKQKNEEIDFVGKNAIFEVEDITANANDEITINISMCEDSNFVAGNFELLYDSDKMKYIKYEKGEILKGAAMSIVNNDDYNAKVSIAYVGNPQDESELIQKGELINITFKINESVSNTKIMPQFNCSTLKEKDGNDIECIINQGTIIVK